jgi:hypothetical protein
MKIKANQDRQNTDKIKANSIMRKQPSVKIYSEKVDIPNREKY